MEAVSRFATQAAKGRSHACDINRNIWVLNRARVEEGWEYTEPVMLASVAQAAFFLEGLPYFAHGGDVVPELRNGFVIPLGAEAFDDMHFDLCAQSQDKASLGLSGQVPCDLRGDHRATRERDGNPCAQVDMLGGTGGMRQGQKRVVHGFRCPQTIEAVVLDLARKIGRLVQIIRENRDIEFHK